MEANDHGIPVLAHAVDLGMTDTITNVAWAVGIVRDPVLTFLGVNRHAYYWSQYTTLDDAVCGWMEAAFQCDAHAPVYPRRSTLL
jgi:hypothetical protein